MVSPPEKKRCDTDESKAFLSAKTIGKTILSYDVVDSTNAIARKLADEGAEEGTVVLAVRQRTGRGRLNREWHSPKGGLWLSVILKPEMKPSEAVMVTLMAGIAVAKTLATYNLNTSIKWPNDVLIRGKKVCGILTEMRGEESKINYLILGLGINVNFDLEELPEPVRDLAITLRHEIEKDLDMQELLSCLLKELDKCYELLKSGSSNTILNTWKDLSETLGRNVKITTQKESIEGIALDVDEIGALIVKTKEGRIHKFVAGDCMHITRAV